MAKLLSELPIGSIVKDGSSVWDFKDGSGYTGTSFGSQPVEWIVAAKDYFKAGTVTLVSKELVAAYAYGPANTAPNWSTSVLRNWLRTTFLSHLSSQFKKNVSNVDVTTGSIKSTENVLVLSASEIGLDGVVRISYFDSGAKRIAKLKATDTAYWARTTDTDTNGHPALVSINGNVIGGRAEYSHFGVRPALNLLSTSKVTDTPGPGNVYEFVFNSSPTITLGADNNKTLYESDTLPITGSARDTDNGDIVNVRYQINALAPRALQTGISDGVTPIPFNKSLTFKGGMLYDGATAITSALAEGVAHTLKVWAEDDNGGKSVVEERTFYVVPNRPPSLTIDTIAPQSSLINEDEILIEGDANDPDGNDIKVSYKLNDGLATEVCSGTSSRFSFKIKLRDLKVGANTIVVEVIDSYNFKFSKTIKLNKTENLTPLLKSVRRYEIIPPSGSAKGVLAWLQHDKDLTVNLHASMTLAGEQEVYKPMTLSNSAPVDQQIMEDEYIFETLDPKEKIMLKLDISRASTDIDPTLILISGVLS